MNVSAEEKPSSGQEKQQPVVEGPGNDPVSNPDGDTGNKNEQIEKPANSEQNAPEAPTKDSKEEGNGNDKQATDKKSTGVENPKEEPTEEDLKSMPVRQYLENTVVGIIMQGMQQLVRKRPDDPIAWLSDFLERNNPKKRKVDQMEEDQAPGEVKEEK